MNMRRDNAGEHQRKWATWKALLWWDYRRHRSGFLIGLPIVVLGAILVGMQEDLGGPMFLFGAVVMGFATGHGLGRGEWELGYEEFSLGLPPTRRDRFEVRFQLGLGFLAVLLACGLAAGPLGWVRELGESLGVSVGDFRERDELWPEFRGVGYFLMSAGLGLACYVESYVVSMNVERGARPNWAGMYAAFVLGALAVVALDRQLFPSDAGVLTGCLALVWSLIRFATGRRAFEGKDVVLDMGSGPSASCADKRRRALVAAVLGLAVLLTTGLWVYLTGN